MGHPPGPRDTHTHTHTHTLIHLSIPAAEAGLPAFWREGSQQGPAASADTLLLVPA